MQQWLTRVDVNVSDNTRIFARYNLQTETQNFPVGLWWRNANQVPYPTAVTAPNRSHSATVEPDPRLRPVADVGIDVRRDLHRLPEPVRGSEQGLALGARLHQPGHLRQRPRPDPVDDRLGQRADDVQPGRLRPRPVRQEVADLRRAERDQGRRRAHDEGRRLLRVGQQQPAGQRRLERPPDSRPRGAPTRTGNYFSDMLTGNLAEYGEQSPNVVRDMAYNIFEGYVQDSWKAQQPADDRRRPPPVAPGRLVRAQRRRHGGVRSRALQLAGGGHAVPRPHLDRHQLRASRPPASRCKGLLFAPRVGFAYDLSGNGETLLRGGYGLFNFHDAQGPYSGFIDLPYGVTFTNVADSPLLPRRRRTSTRTRSRASAAPSWPPTTSSRAPRAGASPCSAGCRIR